MLRRIVKYGLIAAVVLGAGSLLAFGTDAWSYISSSARAMRRTVKSGVPVEFELQRARDLLGQIVPEMHANIRLIAQEEVAIANLKDDIARSETGLADEKARIEKLAGVMASEATVLTVSDRSYPRQTVKDDLARRFERYKEAEVVLAGKRKLLETRDASLQNAVRLLDKAKHQKALLADRIEALAGQYRLVQAASVGSRFQIDSSKIAQTQKVIDEIKDRLDVAERVLAHEGQLVETAVEVDTTSEADLLTQVQEHFAGAPKALAEAGTR